MISGSADLCWSVSSARPLRYVTMVEKRMIRAYLAFQHNIEIVAGNQKPVVFLAFVESESISIPQSGKKLKSQMS